MTKLFATLLAILLIASLAPVAQGQPILTLEEPESCEVSWTPQGFQIYFGPLGCLHDVAPEDAPVAGTGEILYSHGLFAEPRFESGIIIVYHLEMDMPEVRHHRSGGAGEFGEIWRFHRPLALFFANGD